MKRLCSLFLGAILGLTFVVEAGTPTPATQTDLPAKLTGVLNGLPFPDVKYGFSSAKCHRLGWCIKECYEDHGNDNDRYTDNSTCKDLFFNSVGTMFDIIGEDDFEADVKKLGYSFFTGSGIDKKFQISGFFNESTAPYPATFINNLQENYISDRLDNAYNRMNKISSSWTGNFNLSVDISVLGISLKKIDTFANYYMDRGDVYMVQGLNRALAGMVYFLKAYNLPNNKRLIFDFVEKMKGVLGGELDFSLISVTLPEMLGSIKSGSSSDLATAKTDLTAALDCFDKGYKAIVKRSATDKKTYIFGTNSYCKISLKSHNSLYQLFNQGVVSTLKSAMTQSVSLDLSKFCPYTTSSRPSWMRSNLTYRITFSPIFLGKYHKGVVPTKEGLWYKPESVTSSFMGGVISDLTLDEYWKGFENAPIPVLWNYDTYRRLAFCMPFKDMGCTVGAARRIVYTNQNPLPICTVSFDSAFVQAKAGSKLTFLVDGTLKGSFQAGDSGVVNFNVNNGRTLVWEYTPPNNDTLQTARVHPVSELKWLTATDATADVPSVPYEWIIRYGLVKNRYATEAEFKQAILGVSQKGNAYWQDYVVNTDPTNVTERFQTLIKINESGYPEVTFEPEITDPTERAKRRYCIWGRKDLRLRV